MTIQFNH